MRDTLVFVDEPAEAAITAAAAFLRTHGVAIVHQTPYSVAFSAGQIAAVPVQLRPEWCRVWVTVEREGAAAAAAAAYVERQRERSHRVEAAVQQLERTIYDPAQWPAREATLRASLWQQGVAPEAVEARVAAFKQRWLALGRKAARAAPEDSPPTV